MNRPRDLRRHRHRNRPAAAAPVPPASQIVRGAQGIADYLNARLVHGTPFNLKAVYYLVEKGRVPVSRIGKRGLVARTADLDRMLETEPVQ